MRRLALTIWIIAFCMALPLSAQQKKKANAAEKKANVTIAQTAEQLIQSYKFDEAARLLQRDIEQARMAGKSTTRLNADLKRANLGADMLRGTERIEFVDSFKVGRDEVINYIQLSPEAGKIVTMENEVENFTVQPQVLGKCGYINELNNRIIFAQMNTNEDVKNLCDAYRKGNSWGSFSTLEGLQSNTTDQDFPFMMPDGVTLYYAAQGSESLGGYDIFVTRYNAETKQYLKAENIGMPFNSPANDYLLAIDEINNLGWLVTDRNQKADTVCIYVFIPSTTREVYEVDNTNQKHITQVARLHSIAETQYDAQAVADAKQRLANIMSQNQTQQATNKARLYIINDNTVYTSTSQFRNETARKLAEEADQLQDKIESLQAKSDNIQRSFAQGKRTNTKKQSLANIRKSLPKLQKQYYIICKRMRKAELQ